MGRLEGHIQVLNYARDKTIKLQRTEYGIYTLWIECTCAIPFGELLSAHDKLLSG